MQKSPSQLTGGKLYGKDYSCLSNGIKIKNSFNFSRNLRLPEIGILRGRATGRFLSKTEQLFPLKNLSESREAAETNFKLFSLLY